MLSRFLGRLTRYEGKKFLKLSEEIDQSQIARAGTPPDSPISLYIHIPFCRTLCPYCCFNRYLFHEDAARRYFADLRAELDLYIRREFKFSTCYFGGGTPTILMDELLRFIAYLRENFEVSQISVETTPREVSEENVDLLREAGVNRLSIGVQSFNDSLLKAMGRTFCAGEEIKERISTARGKFDTLNVDLLFNFPSQSLETFKTDIAIFKSLGANQVTFYPLMPSPHKKSTLERRFNRIDTSRERKFYNIILEDFYESDYRPSTVWCFSKGERIIDEYVVDFDHYIGIGAGSVSLLNGNFYVNSFSLDRYHGLVSRGELPIVRWRKLSQREQAHYYLLSKLFGMELGRTSRQRFTVELHQKLKGELMLLKLAGVVQGEGGKLTVTRKGMYPLSVMMREFFSALNSLREYCIENQI